MGVGFFLQRSPKNFYPFIDKFFKVAEKERTLRISFFKGRPQKVEEELEEQVGEGGGGGGLRLKNGLLAATKA